MLKLRPQGPSRLEAQLLGPGTLVGPAPHPCQKIARPEFEGYWSPIGTPATTAHPWMHLVPEEVVASFLAPGSCLVVGDAPGDPDCFGSAAAWARCRRTLGLPAEAHINAPPALSIRHLFGEGEIASSATVHASSYETVVLVDNDGQRIGPAAKEALSKAKRVVVVDHHESHPTRESLGLGPETELIVWRQPAADAAALMTLAVMLRGVEAAQVSLTASGWREILEPVLAAVYSDTRGFLSEKASPGTLGLLRSIVESGELDLGRIFGRLGETVPRAQRLELWNALAVRSEEHHGQRLGIFELDGELLLSAWAKARQTEPALTWSDLYFTVLDRVEADAKSSRFAATILALETPASARSSLPPELNAQLPPARTKYSIRSREPSLAVKMAQALGGNGKPGEAGGIADQSAGALILEASRFMAEAAKQRAALTREAKLRCRGSGT